MTYPDWKARPLSMNNAECATVVMGWRQMHNGFGEMDWYDSNGHSHGHVIGGFNPTTDRNATAMLVGEVKKKLLRQSIFQDALFSEGVYQPFDVAAAAPSLVAWACCESCREET